MYLASFNLCMQISNVRLGGVRMLGIEQYKKIQKLKKIGLSKVKVSQQTNLSYKTICNYWNMNENYFSFICYKYECLYMSNDNTYN